jgi:hypothetical protein
MRKPTGAPDEPGSATSCAKLKAIQFISQDPKRRVRALRTISSSSARLPGGSSRTTLRTSAGVDRNPAEVFEMNFGTAVLRFGDDFVRRAEAFVSQFRFCDANAADVARGHAGCAAEAHEERGEVGAFPAEVFRFEHEADVAETAAARFRIAESVVDDPFVDGASFVYVGVSAERDFVGGGFNDAIERHKFGGAEEVF